MKPLLIQYLLPLIKTSLSVNDGCRRDVVA